MDGLDDEVFYGQMIQTSTTTACAYLSILIAESELGASGVLATVTSGAVLARSA